MPDDKTLDAVAQSIGGLDYSDLGPETRAIVFGLAVQVEQNDSLAVIANWFDKSRLWEGEVYSGR